MGQCSGELVHRIQFTVRTTGTPGAGVPTDRKLQ